MTREEVENLFDAAVNEHSRVVQKVLASQSKVEKVLREKKESSASDSTLIAVVVAEMVEEEVIEKGNPVEGFWKMFGVKAAGA